MSTPRSSFRFIYSFLIIAITSAFGYGASGSGSFGPFTVNETAIFSDSMTDRASAQTRVFGAGFLVNSTGGSSTTAVYNSLKEAFDAINLGTHQGTISISITADNVETASAVLNASGAGQASYSSIFISPSGARMISGNMNGSLIDLDGADNVTIDGSNTGGNSLTIRNDSAGTSVSTIRFANDATGNRVTNCTVLGSSQATLGVIYFAGGATIGNDNNVVSNNNIGPAGNLPVNAIYSAGTSGTVDNSGNVVTGNNICDYFNLNLASSGINVDAFNSGWTINNNRFYQSAARTYQASNTHNAIRVASGTGYIINGNIIGSASAAGTGVYTMSSANNTITTRFVGINLAADATVQGNTFASINLSTIGINADFGSLCGINITAGNVNIGNVVPNLFGSMTGTDSLSSVALGTIAATIVGINVSTPGSVLIANNNFGSFTSANPSTPTFVGGTVGIDVSVTAAASLTITGNTIGSTLTDSFRAGTPGVTTGGSFGGGIVQTVPPGAYNYSNNIIRNISTYGAGAGFVRGIQTGVVAATSQATINNNTITNLKTGSALPQLTSGNGSAQGIQFFAGANSTVSGNTISNISNTNTGNVSTVVAGIAHVSATDTVISNNRVWGLSNASTATSTLNPNLICGIVIRSGNGIVTVVNNIVSLGAGQTTNSSIYGIWANHFSVPDPAGDRIYFNSVDIEGVAGAGTTAPTAAFHRGDLNVSNPKLVPVDVRNNIFINNRTGGTGKHYAIANHINATTSNGTGWGPVNSNVLNANPATIGWWTGDRTFAGWQSVSAGDTASYSGIPVNFVNNSSDLHLMMGVTPTLLESGGVTIAGFATDIDGQTRPGPAGSVNGGATAPDLGADEFDGVSASGPTPTNTATATNTPTNTPTFTPTNTPTPQPTHSVAVWDGEVGNWTDVIHWSTTPQFPNNQGGNTFDAIVSNGMLTLNQNIVIQKFSLSGTNFGSTNAFTLRLNDMFNWGGGTIQGIGTIQADGGLAIEGNTKTLLARTINNTGAATWTAEAPISMGDGATFNNQATGTFVNDFDGTIINAGGAMSQFNNAGTFTKSGGEAGGSTNFNVPFNNSGTVNANFGAINFNGGFNQTGGSLTLRGNNSVSSSAPIIVQAGQVVGNGSINAPLTMNGGLISPGFSVGTIVIDGSLTLGVASSFTCEIDSTNVMADRIVANGASIAGSSFSTPDIGTRGGRFLPGSVVPIGTVFIVIDNTSGTPISGQFSGLAEGSIIQSGGNTYRVSYAGGDGNDMTLTFVGVAGTVTYGNAIGAPPAPRFVSNVLISGTGASSMSTVTGGLGPNAGKYVLSGFLPGSYTFTPSKTGGVNSITSFDAGKVAQHAAGTVLLTGNQLLVADVSDNGSITSFDAGQIARYVVSSPPFGITGNWKFNPVSTSHANITSSITGEDFSALLMGEVSGNWTNSGARPALNGPVKRTAVMAPQITAPADSDIIIPISVDAAAKKGIIAYEFDLRYDPSVIQPQSDPIDIAGTVSSKLSAVTNADEPGRLRVAVYGPMPIDGNGVLLNLKFTAVGAPGSMSPLTWERILFNEGSPQTTATDGEVELSAAAPDKAEISGRLLTATGQGVPHARVTLIDAAGQTRSILSNGFGAYRIGGLEVGQSYTIRVESRSYAFRPLTVSTAGRVVGVEMIAEP